MQQRIVINVKGSHKMRNKFKAAFPLATFYGSVSLGSASKAYLISLEEYEARKEEIGEYGTKARHQPFINQQ